MINSIRGVINTALQKQIKKVSGSLDILSGKGIRTIRDLVCWERRTTTKASEAETRVRLFGTVIDEPHGAIQGRVPYADCELPNDRAWLIDGVWMAPDEDGNVERFQQLMAWAAFNLRAKGGDDVAIPYLPLSRLFAGSCVDWSQTAAADGLVVSGRPGDYYPFQVPILVPPKGYADCGIKYGAIGGLIGDVVYTIGLHGLEFIGG